MARSAAPEAFQRVMKSSICWGVGSGIVFTFVTDDEFVVVEEIIPTCEDPKGFLGQFAPLPAKIPCPT
ncbi:MAG: hypothetical protein GY805_32375 [Chloroflexi bacterium]|nr:hypothetical protein [Chloroflexota bacterium]